MERTLILAKPDALQRGLVGRLLTRFEEKGLKIAGLKLMMMTPNLVHGSDSPEAAEKELPLYFSANELLEYDLNSYKWIYDPVEELGQEG